MRLSIFLLFAFVPLILADDTDPKDPKIPAIKEIEKVKGVMISEKTGSVTKPTKVSTAEELEKLIPDKGLRAELTKQVDLTKQYLLVFSWAGSGRDELSYKVEKDEVVFGYKRGLTRDLRRHLKVYALARSMKYKIAG